MHEVEPVAGLDAPEEESRMRRVLGIDPVPAHVRQRQAVGPEGADVGIDEAEQVHAARLLAAASENLFAEAYI